MMVSAVVRNALTSILGACALGYCLLFGLGLTFVSVAPQTVHAQDSADSAAEETESDAPTPKDYKSKLDRRKSIRYGGRPETTASRGKKKVDQASAQIVEGDEPAEPAPDPTPTAPPIDYLSNNLKGVFGQAGHLAFKTFGRNESISPVEAMPFLLTDEHFIFSDLRGFISNSSTFGGNAGVGYRSLRDELNSWFGGSLWFDADGTTGKLYQQVGVSLEAMVDRWEFRSNVYVPITSSQTFTNSNSNARFVGNQLIYSQYIDQGKALTGVDFEAGYNIPVMEPHRLRGFVGYYHFDGGPSGAINGFKTRLEAVINNTVTAQVLYTNDALYGNNVMLGVQFQFPYGDSNPTKRWNRTTPSPFRFVERNYNVILDRTQAIDPNVVAYNPTTNNPYVVEQVSSTAAPGGNGTTNSPFATVAAAQSAGGNLIFVQGNSVLNEAVTLTSGQRLFGDGSSEPLPLAGGGTVTLPNVIVGGQTPQFSSMTGPVVTLASNNEVAGFNFSNITGSAIVGSNITNATIRDDSFTSLTGNGIDISHASGTVLVDNITVNGTNGASSNGLSFANSSASLTVNNLVDTSSGGAAAVSLQSSTGPVVLSNLNINSTNAAGLVANGVSSLAVSSASITTTNFGAVNIQSSGTRLSFSQISTNGGPFGVQLLNDDGTFTIAGNGAYASGGLIQNTTTGMILNNAGTINLSWLDLTGNGTGIQSNNNSMIFTDIRVTNSSGYGLDSLNDTSVVVSGSLFTGNGAAGGGSIRAQASTVATYAWLIENTTINDSKGTPILMATATGGNGATLTATVENNVITGSANNNSLVNVTWNGALTAIVTGNTLTAQGSGMTGVTLQDASTTVASYDTVTTNTMSFTNTQGTGVMIAAAGPNTTATPNVMAIETNTLNFSGSQGIGFRFNLTGISQTSIVADLLTDTGGGATGILFDNIAASSSVLFNSNTFTLVSSDRGVFFTNVTPTITLSSTLNNVITGTTDYFSMPANTSVGDIAINSQPYPAP